MATKKKRTGDGAPGKKARAKQRQERTPLVKVGALWIKSGAKGKFLSGMIDIDDVNSMKLLVFPNGYKEEAKHPDYVVYAPAAEDSTDEEPKPARQASGFPGGEQIGDQTGTTDDDIPF